MISVTTGLINLLGLYYLASKILNPKTAAISALLYTLIPVFFFYDRQALMESSLMSVSIWSLIFFIKLHHSLSPKYALATGIILGLGFFIKSTTLLFLVSFLFLYLYLCLKHRHQLFTRLTLLLLVLTSFILINLPLFLQPLFWSTWGKNASYALTPSEIIHFPLSVWAKTFPGHLQLFLIHLTPPIFIAVVLGSIRLLKSRSADSSITLAWAGLSLAIYLASVRNMNSIAFRYSSPFLPLFILPAAHFLSSHRKFLYLSFIPCFLFLGFLMFDPPAYFRLLSRLTPYSYIQNYVTGSDSGYPAIAIINYFRNLAQNQDIYVTTAVQSFNPEAAIITYFRRHPRITTAYFDYRLLSPQLEGLDCITTDRPLYLVDLKPENSPLLKFLQPVTTISGYPLYTLKTDCDPTLTARLTLTTN